VNVFELKSKEEYIDNFYSFSPEFQPDGMRSMEKAANYISVTLETGRTTFAWMHQKADGTPIPSEVTLVKVKWRNEDHIIVFVRDLRDFYKSMEAEKDAQRKDAEQKALIYYTLEIEQQYNSVRKIQHDYKNILTSLYAYIEDNDLDGLKKYYSDRIESKFNIAAKNMFALEGLSKIKVAEVKSILAAKLMTAHSVGIETNFESKDDITNVYVDTVDLVRMLGIMFDNAIEELLFLHDGRLDVACYPEGDDVTFVISNTCRADIAELSVLKKRGFSTKGKDRGIGLSILSELAGKSDNVALQTIIVDNTFIQKLRIGGCSDEAADMD
jgi:two-component system sensor histidine kinase AgrC